MILLSFIFLVAYLILWRHNKEIRTVSTSVLDRDSFQRYFDCNLDELISRGIIKFTYEKTKYYYFALGSLSLSVLCICVKLINLL